MIFIAFSCLQVEVDARSVYVGNVDYGATAEELEQHFHGCGSINRVTILCNKYDGNPKGFAYVEFTDKESVDTAMALDDSLFRYILIIYIEFLILFLSLVDSQFESKTCLSLI